MKKLLFALLASPLFVCAQDNSEQAKLPRVSFSVAVEKEVAMDILQVRLFVQEESTDLKTLHDKVSEKLNQALSKIKAQSAVRIQQNNRHTSARYNEKGYKNGWLERADLVLESQDFFVLSQLVDTLADTFSIDDIQAKLSPAAQAQMEDEMTQAVLAKFNQKATLTSTALQAKGYRIVNLELPPYGHEPAAYGNYAMEARSMLSSTKSANPVQLESGSTHLKMHVNATIELIQ